MRTSVRRRLQDIRQRFNLKSSDRAVNNVTDPIEEPVEQPDGWQEPVPADESVGEAHPAEQKPADQQPVATLQAEEPVTNAPAPQNAQGGMSIFAVVPLTAKQRATQQLRLPPKFLKSQLVRVNPGRYPVAKSTKPRSKHQYVTVNAHMKGRIHQVAQEVVTKDPREWVIDEEQLCYRIGMHRVWFPQRVTNEIEFLFITEEDLSEFHECRLCGHYAVAVCSGCHKVQYCSEECQQRHWLRSHRQSCAVPAKLGRAGRVPPALETGGTTPHTVSIVPQRSFKRDGTCVVKHPYVPPKKLRRKRTARQQVLRCLAPLTESGDDASECSTPPAHTISRRTLKAARRMLRRIIPPPDDDSDFEDEEQAIGATPATLPDHMQDPVLGQLSAATSDDLIPTLPNGRFAPPSGGLLASRGKVALLALTILTATTREMHLNELGSTKAALLVGLAVLAQIEALALWERLAAGPEGCSASVDEEAGAASTRAVAVEGRGEGEASSTPASLQAMAGSLSPNSSTISTISLASAERPPVHLASASSRAAAITRIMETLAQYKKGPATPSSSGANSSSDDAGSSRFGSPYSEQTSPLPDFRDAARMQLRPLNVPVRLVPPAPKEAACEARPRRASRDGQASTARVQRSARAPREAGAGPTWMQPTASSRGKDKAALLRHGGHKARLAPLAPGVLTRQQPAVLKHAGGAGVILLDASVA